MGLWIAPTGSALLLAGLAVYVWFRRPPAPLWPLVLVCQILALLWVVGDLWASVSGSVREEHLALALLYTGALPLPVAWWTTARLYVVTHGLGRPWMRSRWVRWLPPVYVVAAWSFAITNPWHGQILTPRVLAPNEHYWGAALLAHTSYAIALATFGLCLWSAHRHRSADVSRRMVILAIATLAPLATNFAHVYLRLGPRTDEAAIGLGLGCLAILYGVSRQRLFNPLPIALQEVQRRDPAGVMLLDPRGRLLYWNPSAARLLTGLELEPDMDLVPALADRLVPVDGAEAHPFLQGLSRTGVDEEPRVYRDQRGDGDRYLRVSMAPISSRRNRAVALSLRLEDVTELERIERQRRQLSRRIRQLDKLESLGVMAGGVAHDFNNLLTAIRGFADLSLGQAARGGELRENLRLILEATDVATRLTQELLSYSGRSRMIREPVALSELVAETVSLLRGSLPTAVKLQIDHATGLPAVHADATQLRQVVMNLVTNAGEAMGGGGGSVTLRCFLAQLDTRDLALEGLDGVLEAGDYVGFEVEDTGRGIDADALPQIFEPFFSTKEGGRGLGLAAVFGIVRAHGGAISVRSEKDFGTRFRVWLPASYAERAEHPSPAAPVRGSASASRSGTVLLVDDQAAIRRLVRRVLERAGLEVLTAASGSEAVELQREHADRIGLVVLDLTMPGTTGDEVLRRIRRVSPDVRVLLSSGYDESDAMSRIPREKVWGFIPKPYEPAELLRRVRQALSGEESATPPGTDASAGDTQRWNR